jgi:hypothetical protein
MDRVKGEITSFITEMSEVESVVAQSDLVIKKEERKTGMLNSMLKALLDYKMQGVKINFDNVTHLKSRNGKFVTVTMADSGEGDEKPKISYEKFMGIMEAFQVRFFEVIRLE